MAKKNSARVKEANHRLTLATIASVLFLTFMAYLPLDATVGVLFYLKRGAFSPIRDENGFLLSAGTQQPRAANEDGSFDKEGQDDDSDIKPIPVSSTLVRLHRHGTAVHNLPAVKYARALGETWVDNPSSGGAASSSKGHSATPGNKGSSGGATSTADPMSKGTSSSSGSDASTKAASTATGSDSESNASGGSAVVNKETSATTASDATNTGTASTAGEKEAGTSATATGTSATGTVVADAGPEDITTVPGHPQISPVWASLHKLFRKKAESGHDIDVLIIGDKLAQNWHLKTDTGGAKALSALRENLKLSMYAFGIAEDYTARIRWRVQNGELPPNPKAIILYVGMQELAYGGNAPTDLAKYIINLAEEIKRLRPNAHVIIQGLLPTLTSASKSVDEKVLQVNAAIASTIPGSLTFMDCSSYFVNAQSKVIYMSGFVEDSGKMLMLNTNGYGKLGDCLQNKLKRLLKI